MQLNNVFQPIEYRLKCVFPYTSSSALKFLGATFSATVTNGQLISIDYLPKAQARMLYRYAQEQEEQAFEDRRTRSMEESRAAAGGVVVQNAYVPPTAAVTSSPAEDPLAALQKLKTMLDAGLISPEEFAAKKAEILSRM